MYVPLMNSMRSRAARAALAVPAALGVTASLTLAGCSFGGSPAPGPNNETPAASATPAPTLPEGVTPAPIPTKVANDPDDRKNVVMTGCAATKGGWGANGTATNAGKAAVSYDITVFFTTTSATTIDSARTTVEVKAGETVKWSAAKKFAAPDQMLCVLRGVAAA